jgi:hypothetical protein
MLYRKPTLAVLLALIFFSFFGTLTASAWMFPKNYDWRYRVISNLLSPRDNPNHYWLAASGAIARARPTQFTVSPPVASDARSRMTKRTMISQFKTSPP